MSAPDERPQNRRRHPDEIQSDEESLEEWRAFRSASDKRIADARARAIAALERMKQLSGR